MQQATFRFYAELNDFLPERRRHRRITHRFEPGGSVKEMIESLGIPHTRVDLILVNDESVEFAYLVQDGDRVTVYPVFETFDISTALRVRSSPLRQTRFVLDARLERLAWYLRLLGFDAVVGEGWSDDELQVASLRENRILLAPDSRLMEGGQITHGYCVRSSRPHQQAAEVIRRFHLQGLIEFLRRCARCNTLLTRTKCQSPTHGVSDSSPVGVDPVELCPACSRPRPRESHSRRIQRLLRLIVDSAR